MAKILVYAEQASGKPAAISLELLTKARDLGETEAVALGKGAGAAAAVLGKHGAATVHVNEDAAYDEYVAEPQTDAVEALVKKLSPDLLLFGFTPDSREVAGRLAARLDVGLISNAQDVEAGDGGFRAKVPYFGGARVASMQALNSPAIVLLRPKSFEPSEAGGEAKVEKLEVSLGDGSRRARVTDRVQEAGEQVKLEEARVV